MNGTAPFTPKDWQGFYVVIGSAAGALTGLQFVVLTLITEAGLLRGSGEALAAFGSPNVFHFCIALFVAGIFSAPWRGLGPPGVAGAVAGAIGLVYSIVVLVRALRQKDYKPVLEDWTWHAAFPIFAYAGLVHAGVRIAGGDHDAMYITGGAVLLLVFIGIHNVWDTVTYVTMERAREQKAKAAAAKPSAAPPGSPPAPAAPPPQAR